MRSESCNGSGCGPRGGALHADYVNDVDDANDVNDVNDADNSTGEYRR
ncbi:hypothetical protein ACIPYQ_35665 [Streptomyces sp. NPDC090045]